MYKPACLVHIPAVHNKNSNNNFNIVLDTKLYYVCAVCFVWPCAPLLCVIPSQILRSAADTRDIALCGYKYIYKQIYTARTDCNNSARKTATTKIPLCVYGSSRHSGCCEAHNWLAKLSVVPICFAVIQGSHKSRKYTYLHKIYLYCVGTFVIRRIYSCT